MRKLLAHRPSHGTVVGYIALFVALGGSAYAATQIGSAQIRNNSIKSADVKNRSLLAKDFRAGQLPAGSQGPQGSPGPAGQNGAPGQNGADGATGAPGSAKGWMRVNPANGVPGGVTATPMTSPPPRSKGVISVVQPDLPPADSPAGDSKYCFDLTFTPEVAATSPNYNNNATVGVTVPSDFGSSTVGESACPADHRDAVVQTFAANTSAGVHDTIFSVIFE